MNRNSDNLLPFGFYVKLTFLAWLSMIGFDFFLHAGLLASRYAEPSSFLLPPERAFALIPVGYLSFLSISVLLIWLMARLKIQGWKQGVIFGVQYGLLAGGSLVLGLYSISTASPALLFGWFLGQTVELGIVGIVAGDGFASRRLGRLFVKVMIFVMIAFVAGVILQNI